MDSSLPFLNPQLPCAQELLPSEAFILQMVYSIACQCVPDRGNQLLSLSDACYARALKNIDSATANLTVETLQAITLLALRSLFDPQNGNFGQLVAFAARLAIDIGGQDIPAWGENMRNIHTSIYCMERQFATALDRPPFLPEPTRSINFDISQPSEYLCSLFRIQTKFRGGKEVEAGKFFEMIDIADLEQKVKLDQRISPNILCTVYETQLLLNPTSSAAATMLASYHHPRFIQTFLTAQWIYRAALIVLQPNHNETPSEFDRMQAYGQSLVLLDRASIRWKGSVALSESLRLVGQRIQSRNH
ncbi:hypothetical protein BP5796_08261 [Coleophoma crateriformis]|uniref:Xylanolytic transcriptional activator regulatory domain-containing protein n=1 Tax=Coleophoma crateriformis TaxID=565419 RepID=A0A3D8RDT5_9HELO|nr:hypothetical protein BP5796_08261 [Coleophoma crateriformis]